MIGVHLRDSSTSLRKQVAGCEARLLLRRQRVRALLGDANQKASAQLTSPGMLLAAVGVGFAVEQVGHRRQWTLAAMIEAGHTCTGLLLALGSFRQQVSDSE